jgi:alkylation response protein AidB-like acyl-CoA dehydrogenase
MHMAMTFDLSTEQAAAQARARELAAALSASAAGIDATATIPAEVQGAVGTLDCWAGDDAVATLVMIEELAVASPSAAAAGSLGVDGPPADLAGLRGVPRVTDPDSRHYLAMGAVCLGIGRAALGEATRVARARGDRPAGEPADPPHWVLADAATEVDAARLLLLSAAAGHGQPAAAMVHAGAAAGRAVEAALRIVGPEAQRPGSLLERCARDARAAWLILGTEDEARRVAADALLA